MKKILIGIMLIATVLSHTSCKNDVARALSELYGKKMSFEWKKVAVYPDTVGGFLNESVPARIFVCSVFHLNLSQIQKYRRLLYS